MISIKKNKEPSLKRPTFTVDEELNEKLNNIEIFKLMNKAHCTLFLGKPGSGKSSLAISFLNSHQAFKKCFHEILLFCPPNSRASVKNDFWGQNLPEDAIYDELNNDSLKEAYAKAEANKYEDMKTLIILDDVQKYLKGECEKTLLDMINNRRHARLCIWLCCQNYKNIPLKVRSNLTDLFVFKVSKKEAQNILEEQLEMNETEFNNLNNKIFKKPHDFLYIHPSLRKHFYNWDEIIIE